MDRPGPAARAVARRRDGGTRVGPGLKVAVLTVGGALGVNARYWLGLWISGWAGARFPWATLAINVSGSFALGFFGAAHARWLPHPSWGLLVAIGFLGGYTTFSTFTLESLTLLQRGETLRALAYLSGSVAGGLMAVAMGVLLGRALAGTPG
jgi:fluoride exporter